MRLWTTVTLPPPHFTSILSCPIPLQKTSHLLIPLPPIPLNLIPSFLTAALKDSVVIGLLVCEIVPNPTICHFEFHTLKERMCERLHVTVSNLESHVFTGYFIATCIDGGSSWI